MRWVLVVLVVVACRGEVAKPLPVIAAPKPPADLWAMAPEGTVLGIAISPRGLKMLEHALDDVDRFLAEVPDLAPVRDMLQAAVVRTTGDKTVRVEDLGFGPKGAAVFAIDRQHVVAILPVADRARFVARLHGTSGKDHDTFGFGTCRGVWNVYACATSEELFAKLGKLDLGPRLVGRHGDVEIVVTDSDEIFHAPIAATLDFERGAVTARGVIDRVPPALKTLLGSPVRPRVDRASAAGFAVAHFGPRTDMFSANQIVPGLDSNDLVRAGGGPVTAVVTAGAPALDIRVSLANPGAIQKMIDRCTSVDQLAPFRPTVDTSGCHVHPPNIDVHAWIENGELRIGTRPMPRPEPLPLTAAGAELADHEWSFAAWGRAAFAPLAASLAAAFKDRDLGMRVGIRAMFMLNELGVGIRVEGDRVAFFAHVRTLWANSDDLVTKVAHLKALDELPAIVRSAPHSAFASDAAAGVVGNFTTLQVLKLSTIFMATMAAQVTDHIENTEALKQLHSISANLKAHVTAYGGYPVGDVKPSPVSCCKGADHKCPVADWSNPVWTKIQFDISTPTQYRYGYRSDGKTVDVFAVGDLDCDGKEATYTLHLDAAGASKISEPPAGVR
jgi:hypothetical protein